MEQYGVAIERDRRLMRPDLHPSTAALVGTLLPRGHGLVTSSFGPLAALPTVNVTLNTWRAGAAGTATGPQLRRAALQAFIVGYYGTDVAVAPRRAPPPVDRSKGYYVLKDLSVFSSKIQTQVESPYRTAEVLLELRLQKCKAVPVEVGIALTQEQNDKELIAQREKATVEDLQTAAAWMAHSLGGAYQGMIVDQVNDSQAGVSADLTAYPDMRLG